MSEHKVLAHVDEYLKIGLEYDCSDVHLPTAYPPTWRRFGTLAPIWDGHPPLTEEDTERLAMSFLGDKEKADWKKEEMSISPTPPILDASAPQLSASASVSSSFFASFRPKSAPSRIVGFPPTT